MIHRRNAILNAILKEHIFFALLLGLVLYGYWASSQRISLGFLRPSFFRVFLYTGLFTFLFLLVGRIVHLFGSRWIPRSRQTILEIGIPLLLIGISIYPFRFLFVGEFPTTFDHTTQMLRCFLAEFALWHHGTLLPWTSAFDAGVPLNDLYPPAATTLYCAIRIATFFLLSQKIAYLATVFLSWLIVVGSVYLSGRLFFGIPGGVVGAGLLLLSAGNHAQVGWYQALYMGMWPMALCCGLVLITIALHVFSLTRKVRPWVMLSLAVSVFATILAHPFGFTVLVVALPLLTMIGCWGCDDGIRRWRSVGRNLNWIVLGAVSAGWWLFPFLLSHEWILPFGAPNQSGYNLAVNLIDTKFLQNTPLSLALSC